MKNQIILLLLLLTGIIGYTQNFNGGLIGGLTATQISGDQLGGYNKLGLDIGGFVNLKTGKYTALEMELKYIQKGSKSKLSPFASDSEIINLYRLRLNYIEMPFVFKYNLQGISKRQSNSTYHLLKWLTVELGLAYAVLLSHSEKDLTNTYLYDPNPPPFSNRDFSWIAGIYYNINKNLQVNFRRTGSIIRVRQHKGGGVYRLNRGQYNDVVEFTLHYQIQSHKGKTE